MINGSCVTPSIKLGSQTFELKNIIKSVAFSQFSTMSISGSGVEQAVRSIKSMTLNFGPNHPAAHGILRLSIQTLGEVIQRLDPQFGFLHRGTEKLFEWRSFVRNIPYFDRFDYVANLFQEHAYCLSVEQLNADVAEYQFNLAHVRSLFDEFSRILNHLLTLSATCLDLGSMGPVFWAFEERERLMEFYERASGARMHTALYKPFDFDWTVLNTSFLLDISRFLMRVGRSVSGAVMGFTNNRVLKSRLASVGMLSFNKIQNYGISGLTSRSCGIKNDLRLGKNTRYGAYWNCSIRTFLGKRGDNLDRFLARIKESFESFRICTQLLSTLSLLEVNKGVALRSVSYFANSHQLASSNNLSFFSTFNTKSKFTGMEELINHFRAYSEGSFTGSGLVYYGVEAPKGEIGTFLVSSGQTKPYRLKVRTPVSHNMHLIPSVCNGLVFGDFVMTFCSLDIVLGEIDR